MPDLNETSRQLVDFETLIAELSSRFISLPVGEVDRAIDDTLSRVCTWFDLDLAVLWQWSTAAPGVIMATHHHSALEGRPPPQPLDERQFPWCRQQMLDGKVIVVSSLDDLPPEAEVDRETVSLHGVRSSLALPLAVGGEPPVGALGLNDLREGRRWRDADVRRLKLVAQLITNALARRRADESLQQSEERLRLAVDAAGAGLWTLDAGSGVFWCTPQARAIFGYAADEVLTLERLAASIHPDDRNHVLEALRRSLRAGDAIDVEYRLTVAGRDSVRWIASRGRPMVISGERAHCLMGISIDISQRRRLEAELRASQDRMAVGAELAGLCFYEVDFGSGMARLDERACDLLGLDRDTADGPDALRRWQDGLHPEDRPRVLQLREQLHGGKLQHIAVEYRYLHPERGEVWIDHLATVAERDADGCTVRSYGVLRDIGIKKGAELELQDVNRRLLLAQEQERAMIARELHDDLTQRLAVLAIDVGRAEADAADLALAPALRSVREQLVRISEDVHSVAYQLHPSILAELGLAEALRAEAERRRRQDRLDISLALEPLPQGVGRDTELCLFRVAQEALSNLIRHARASRASVQLRPREGGILLAVSDDGVGFDPGLRHGGRRLGMASMRERMRIVNGTLDIDSAPGSGTTVVAWAPIGAAPP